MLYIFFARRNVTTKQKLLPNVVVHVELLSHVTTFRWWVMNDFDFHESVVKTEDHCINYLKRFGLFAETSIIFPGTQGKKCDRLMKKIPSQNEARNGKEQCRMYTILAVHEVISSNISLCSKYKQIFHFSQHEEPSALKRTNPTSRSFSIYMDIRRQR